MTPIDEAVGILRGLSSQVKEVAAHCIELRTDPEEGTYVSLEYLCGDLALWIQARVTEAAEVDEMGRAWVTAQMEPLSLPQPLAITRLVSLSQRLQGLWPSLHADVSIRNRGDEECIVEGEWFGEVGPQGGSTLFAAVAALLHEMPVAAKALAEALQEAERMQEVEERVAGLLLGPEHSTPRRRSGGPKRRRSPRR